MTDPTQKSAAENYAELSKMLLGDAAAKLGAQRALPDPAEMMKLFAAATTTDNGRWLELNSRYYREQLELWQAYAGTTPEAVKPARPQDKRFGAAEWQEPYFSYLAHSYLLSAQWLEEITAGAPLEPQARNKLSFYTRQLINALSPANFPWTNPEAIKLAAATDGDSINRGLKNLAADIDRGLVSMTDHTAFEVGRNLAITPGAVVYENDFMQLLQYLPLTETVHERPLVMVPPCDQQVLHPRPAAGEFLCPAMRWKQGHTVFMVSWRNMSGRSMGKAHLGRLPLELGVLQSDRAVATGDFAEQAPGERARFLRRRHAAGRVRSR